MSDDVAHRACEAAEKDTGLPATDPVRFDPAPLLLAFVLGRLFEPLLRQELILGYGDPMVFLASPFSAGFLAAAALIMAWPLLAAPFR